MSRVKSTSLCLSYNVFKEVISSLSTASGGGTTLVAPPTIIQLQLLIGTRQRFKNEYVRDCGVKVLENDKIQIPIIFGVRLVTKRIDA